MLACWVFKLVGSNPNTAIKQKAATPKARVTSTSEKAAGFNRGRFMLSEVVTVGLAAVNFNRGVIARLVTQAFGLENGGSFIGDRFLRHQRSH
jgi:hypothetical protein